MQKTRIDAIVALTAFVLMLTIASSSFTGVSFSQMDIHGNRFSYPVAGWKKEGPSPWYYGGPHASYNMSIQCFNPYSLGPSTSHMLWTNPLMNIGGSHGGDNPNWGWYPGGHMGLYLQGIVAIGGKIYVAGGSGDWVGLPKCYLWCLDELTGEVVWRWDPPTDESAFGAPLFARNMLSQYGALTVIVYGPMNSGRVFEVDACTGKLLYTWEPLGGPFPWAQYMAWDTSYKMVPFVPWPAKWIVNAEGFARNMLYCYYNDYINPVTILWKTDGAMDKGTQGDIMCTGDVVPASCLMGINITSGTTLWMRPHQALGGCAAAYNNFYVPSNDGNCYCFDMKTGKLVWKADLGATCYWSEWKTVSVGAGLLCIANYDGCVYCLDAFTGEVQWVQAMGACPYEPYKSFYGTWVYGGQGPIGAGIPGNVRFYAATGDHIEWDPNVPGELLKCFNGETGEILWQYPAYLRADAIGPAIADGLLFFPNGYEAAIDCFGKGDTAVEVSVPKAQISKGEYTWITGTVTDQSPAQKGTPCVAKEFMDAWMAYLHQAMPAPDTKTGVPVTLYAQGSDGNTIEIGTVTTNGDTGQFSTMWTPPDEDMYTITAVFSGDESYWDSWGSTELAVGPVAASVSSISGIYTPTMTIATVAVIATCVVVAGRTMKNRREETEK